MCGLGCPYRSSRGVQGTPRLGSGILRDTGILRGTPCPCTSSRVNPLPAHILAPGCHRSTGPDPRGMLPLKFPAHDLLPSLSCCRVQRRPGESEGAGEAGSRRKPAGAGHLERAR